MGLFSKRSSKEPGSSGGHGRKMSSYDVHDPVLTALRDEEPFQMSSNTHYRTPSSIPTDMTNRDIFGNHIDRPDRSNPGRPRNERPLDTIRAFEYACTGDERLREQMETPRLGWNTRSTFMPRFETNPYAASSPVATSTGGIAGANEVFKTYVAPVPEKKAKRGLFGRKKK